MPRHYNLQEIYQNESPLQRYIRLTVGEESGIWALLWHELVLGVCTGLPGLLGIGLRHLLYPHLFPGMHKRSFLGRHVTLRCPRKIVLGRQVVIDDFVQLVATSRHTEAIRIGAGSSIRSYAMLNAGPPEGFIHIGEHSSIGQATILYGNGGLTIGNKVMIAGQCFIVASSHRYEDSTIPMADQGYTAQGITIADNVWIGAGAKILDGVNIGEGAIVGANAVVTRSVPPHTTVVGIPARPLTVRPAPGEGRDEKIA